MNGKLTIHGIIKNIYKPIITHPWRQMKCHLHKNKIIKTLLHDIFSTNFSHDENANCYVEISAFIIFVREFDVFIGICRKAVEHLPID